MFERNNTIRLLNSLLIFTMVSLTGCDSSIQPIVNKGKAYSIYGPLDLQSTPNYIRVHDTNDLLNKEMTEDLGVQFTMTNLSTGESQLLNDEVLIFDSLYTHNFRIPDPVEYDTRYKFLLEDEEGFRDSVISVTTKKTDLSIVQDTVGCNENFILRFTNVDLDAGERIDTEVGVKIGVAWAYTTRPPAFQQYDRESNTLFLGWSPNGVSSLINQLDWVPCGEFSSIKIRFSFTHIGYMEVGTEGTTGISGNPIIPQKVVLSKYGGSTEITIDSTEFQ
jgi:hypothetical protein